MFIFIAFVLAIPALVLVVRAVYEWYYPASGLLFILAFVSGASSSLALRVLYLEPGAMVSFLSCAGVFIFSVGIVCYAHISIDSWNSGT